MSFGRWTFRRSSALRLHVLFLPWHYKNTCRFHYMSLNRRPRAHEPLLAKNKETITLYDFIAWFEDMWLTATILHSMSRWHDNISLLLCNGTNLWLTPNPSHYTSIHGISTGNMIRLSYLFLFNNTLGIWVLCLTLMVLRLFFRQLLSSLLFSCLH